MSRSNIYLILLTVMLIYCSIDLVLPELSIDLTDYYREDKVLKKTWINEERYVKNFQNRIEQTLILEMSDSSYFKVYDENIKYWDEIQRPENLNKKVVLYTNMRRLNVPCQLEINGKIIYNL